jgi:hypothetical protein
MQNAVPQCIGEEQNSDHLDSFAHYFRRARQKALTLR